MRLTRRGRIVVVVVIVLGLVLASILGYAAYLYFSLDNGMHRSAALAGVQSGGAVAAGADIDLLLMGLDSRLDVNGRPLPAQMYQALHTGDESVGGFNSNTLMYLHIPADGSKATAIAIPRDDYVDLPGCPSGVCTSKIKEAYGLAFNQKTQELFKQGVTGSKAHQQARDAGRAAEVATVEKFLGVRINHFVEVTMVGFFQIAQVVQPITVCVKEDTEDQFSGANFKAGTQQINAEQAMAFVRQRRDTVHPELNFTDLDRSRRQQAFIVSLFLQLKAAGTLLNPAKLTGIIDVASQNTAIDDGLSPLQLAVLGAKMSGGNIHFYTLPVKEFGTSPKGASINVVDPVEVRATVQRLLHPPASSTPTPSPSASTHPGTQPTTQPTIDRRLAQGTTVSVVNASGQAGAAGTVMTRLTGLGLVQGRLANGPSATSRITYGAHADAVAGQVGALLGIPASADTALGPGQIQVVLGTDYHAEGGGSTGATASAAPTDPVSATGGGRSGPPPTALTDLSATGVPCVK